MELSLEERHVLNRLKDHWKSQGIKESKYYVTLVRRVEIGGVTQELHIARVVAAILQHCRSKVSKEEGWKWSQEQWKHVSQRLFIDQQHAKLLEKIGGLDKLHFESFLAKELAVNVPESHGGNAGKHWYLFQLPRNCNLNHCIGGSQNQSTGFVKWHTVGLYNLVAFF